MSKYATATDCMMVLIASATAVYAVHTSRHELPHSEICLIPPVLLGRAARYQSVGLPIALRLGKEASEYAFDSFNSSVCSCTGDWRLHRE